MPRIFASRAKQKAHADEHLAQRSDGSSNNDSSARHVHVAILGAGFSGLGMANGLDDVPMMLMPLSGGTVKRGDAGWGHAA